MVFLTVNKRSEDIKNISDWLFLLGGIFILIGILDLIILLVSGVVENNVFLLSTIWCIGFLLLGLISLTGGAIIYTINTLFREIDKELQKFNK